MALGRKGLTCGAIKGLTGCCVCFLCGLCMCFTGFAMQSHTKQCAGSDRGDLYCLHTGLSPIGNPQKSLGAGGEALAGTR
ncbi:unnamed protein product [Staurois parvus]|uniref:Uncharacterized protein n=1 Tax=Staurois parvus TaxID=386267 RepID=A0ABN9BGD7_9NEOB|nr:unnamed protein product [Staurois parvus]